MQGINKYISQLQDFGFSIPTIYKSGGEGNTSLSKLAIGSQTIFIKREDQNPTGSFKDRSMSYWIPHIIENYRDTEKKLQLCISSTGNAAISAAYYSNLYNIPLSIFISKNLSQEKLDRLQKVCYNSSKINTYKVDNPKAECIKFAKETNAYNLRESIDDIAKIGYITLGLELGELDIDAIFLLASSGTAAIGIYQGLVYMHKNEVSIHLSQIPQCARLERAFKGQNGYEYTDIDGNNYIDCISDRLAKRESEVIDMIDKASGDISILEDIDMLEAKKILNFTGIEIENITNNSLGSFASYVKYTKSPNKKQIHNPCIIFTGR